MTLRYSTDIVIFGGGVAGLWLLNAVRDAGYQAILFERSHSAERRLWLRRESFMAD